MNILSLYQIFIEDCEQKISSDSRMIEPYSLFFAWKGETANGNEFVAEAFEKGCNYAVVDDKKYVINNKCIFVPDSMRALQELARHHREQFNIPVLAIGGSNGKTTTKNLISHVVATQKDTVSSFGSLNNHVGVPKTLLRINSQTDIVVLEMGANHLGEMAELCTIAKPTHGLITNIGRDHIGLFGGLGAIIESHLELYAYLKKTNGHIFVNKEDNRLMSYLIDSKPTCYGNGKFHELCVDSLGSSPYVSVKWKQHTLSTQLTGEYNVENIAAAIAVGVYFSITDANIIHGIESYKPYNNRSELEITQDNVLIKDYYNANRTSMEYALDNLIHISKTYPEKETVAILGDMLDLGDYTHDEHQAVVDYAQDKGIGRAILIGPDFKSTHHREYQRYLNVDEAIIALQKKPIKDSVILLKASKGTNFGKLFKELEW
jgi:UDP-N-acetylmuramoyl-tripeptide--D-alanyl-D-alanine ligase